MRHFRPPAQWQKRPKNLLLPGRIHKDSAFELFFAEHGPFCFIRFLFLAGFMKRRVHFLQSCQNRQNMGHIFGGILLAALHILGVHILGFNVSANVLLQFGNSFHAGVIVLGCVSEVAVFSIFRHAAETPIYRIEKRPKLRQAQGIYAVIAMDGRILKRGHDLPQVLRVFDRKLIRAVDQPR